MAEYGLTPQGVVIKRLDVIMDELHDDLTEGWGANTRRNPQSLLNVQLTSFADKMAELWELGEHIYNSTYPYSAEGISLDNAIQFGGITRESDARTRYPIHCECIDGTEIPRGSVIKTDTNPAINFMATNDALATRSQCNMAKIRIAALHPSNSYTIALDGTLYSHVSIAKDDEPNWEQRAISDILLGLSSQITGSEFTTVFVDDILHIVSASLHATHEVVLSGNLTTESVTCVVMYSSEAFGEIVCPNNTITQIVTAVTGLIDVVNLLPYIAGRLRQTDVETRQSYQDKIYSRSNRMINSVKGAILDNVQGVRAVAGYQNDTNTIDSWGRWPHCVEFVVDGGDDMEIALQIFDKKTDGIQAFGDIEVIVAGDEGEPIPMRFNRPQFIYVWFKIVIERSGASPLPPNYVEAIQKIVVNEMQYVEPGKPIIPQRLIEHIIYSTIPGISHISTTTNWSSNEHDIPDEYFTGAVPITPRQRAVTDLFRIGVDLSG